MFVSSVWSMSESSKRQNFTLLEKSALAECIIKYKHIIENKSTDAVTNKQKQDAWNSIAEEFNKIPGVTLRTVKQLNFCYKNLKRKAKKRKAYETELRNGGCPTVTHEDDAINETLFAIGAAASPQEEVFECDNFPNVQISDSEEGNLDKDADNLEKDNSENAPDEIMEKAVVPVEQQPVLHVISPDEATKSSTPQASKTQKHEVYSPLQKNEVEKFSRITPTSKLLKKMRRDCTASSAVTAALLEELKLKNEFLREEHELMMKYKKEKHDIKMEILRADLKIKKKMLAVLETDRHKINFSLNLSN